MADLKRAVVYWAVILIAIISNDVEATKCKSSAHEVNTCLLPLDPGPCKGFFPRWYFNEADNMCLKFTYGGCKGNKNRFATQEECYKACPMNTCLLPPNPGPCKAGLRRWYFNEVDNKCLEFTYGGCRGNKNRFATQEECDKTCQVNTCLLPLNPGPCKGFFPRWYFNEADNKCLEFTYGGCKGNKNRFATQEKCDKACPMNTCLLPLNPGPCKGFFPRWYFNEADNKCQKFTYGGCKGNKNRFATQEECDKACPTDICMLPVDAGPCEPLISIARWFYNAKKGECTKFFYGGCKGNKNNFHTEKGCKRACVKKCH